MMLGYSRVIATHIVGGEIYYDYLGGNNYKITLKVYRDCSNAANAPFDVQANLMIYTGAGSFYSNILIPNPVITSVPSQINNPCVTTPNLCVEEAIYTTTANLPSIVGGYNIVYQRCCRNGTIINLVQPGSVGSSYMEHIPGSNEIAINSSPRFNNRPLKFICNGIPIEFDHSATDPDGDSLVYELCDPFTGLSPCCPVLDPNGNPGGANTFCPSPPSSCPSIGQAPPYATVPFISPYSGAYPLSSNPAININSQTGFLDGIPNINGQWVVGVCVLEYRNGVLVGTHKRDFQFNVVQCTVASSAAVANQTTYCFGYTVDFHNLSYSSVAGGATYSWNFGDNSTLADTSHLFEPSYTYPDTGRYSVHLVVNEGKPCADSTDLDFYIYPVLDPNFSFTYSNACINANSFDFVGAGSFAPYATFNWNFGPSANPSSSTSLVQNNVQFTGPGPFPVVLTMQQVICNKSYSDTVFVYPEPQAYFSPQLIDGCQPQEVQFTDSSLSSTPLQYLWLFGDGDSSTLANPSHVYQDTGVFNLTLTVYTTTGCMDTSTFTVQNLVSIKPSPVAGFMVTPLITDVFNPVFTFVDTSFQASSLTMNMGDGSVYGSVPHTHFYEEFGDFDVTQIAIGSNGCPDTFTVKIKVKPEELFWIPNAFTPNGDYINGVFKPEIMGATDYVFYVYNRWGEKIFETHDMHKGWDGTYKGNKCQEDVYVYLIRYTELVNYEGRQHAGTFSLIR